MLQGVLARAIEIDGGPTDRDLLEMGGLPVGPVASAGTRGWVLAHEHPGRALGPALGWARTRGVDDLTLYATEAHAAQVLERRNRAMGSLARVLSVEGAQLAEVQPAAPEPTAHIEAPEFTRLAERLGLMVSPEHDHLSLEYRGLEVGRIQLLDGAAVLDVGVGHNDQVMSAVMHAGRDQSEVLADAVERIKDHRRPGADPHPVNRLARERWLRAVVIAEPALVGATEVWPIAPVDPRTSIKELVPAPALCSMQAEAGSEPRTGVVVCSVGIDPDLVPTAADIRGVRALEPDAPLVLVIPERDRHDFVTRMAERLAGTRIVTVTPPWEMPPA